MVHPLFLWNNLGGILFYLHTASITWAHEWTRPDRIVFVVFGLAPILNLSLLGNLNWLVIIGVGIWRHNRWFPLLTWLSMGLLWFLAVQYDCQRYQAHMEELGPPY